MPSRRKSDNPAGKRSEPGVVEGPAPVGTTASSGEQWDLFLCHSSVDKSWVRELGDAIEKTAFAACTEIIDRSPRRRSLAASCPSSSTSGMSGLAPTWFFG